MTKIETALSLKTGHNFIPRTLPHILSLRKLRVKRMKIVHDSAKGRLLERDGVQALVGQNFPLLEACLKLSSLRQFILCLLNIL